MVTEKQVRQALNQVLERKWPKLEIRAEFRPCLDLSSAHLYSRVCFELSKHLRKDPQQIAEELMKELSQLGVTSGIDARCGYLNLREADLGALLQTDWIETELLKPPASPVMLIVPVDPQDRQGGVDSHIRIWCRALVQSVILHNLGVEVWICRSEGECSGYRYPGEQASLRSAIEYLSDSACTTQSISTCSPADGATIVEWRGFKRDEGHRPSLIQRNHSRDWASLTPAQENALDLLNSPDSTLACYVYYMAGELSAAELDLSAPRYGEIANLQWFLEESCARIDRLMCRYTGAGEGKSFDLSEHEVLLARGRYLHHFISCAALWGEVGELLTALEEFLRRFNRFLNDPDRRRRIEAGTLEREEQAMILSVSEVLIGVRELLRCSESERHSPSQSAQQMAVC